jgi:hypothetical protein
MAGGQIKRHTRVTAKNTTDRAVTKKAGGRKSAVKKSGSTRRVTNIRAKRPSVAVVVLSGSTPLRRNKAAELVAEELQLDLMKADLSSVVSRYAGETEKNINRLFDEAERGRSILFFDGADTLSAHGLRIGARKVTMRMREPPICCNASRTTKGW